MTQGAHDCPFCAVAVGESKHRYDTVLWSNDHWLLLPALGPLEPGHVLLVSRGHSTGLATVSEAENRSYTEAAAVVSDLLATIIKTPVDVLEAEHGTPDPSAGSGPCISHTHVNLLPTMGPLLDSFEGRLPLMSGVADVRDVKGPYIFLRSTEVARLFDATGAPPQLIRRVLSHSRGIDDWDWSLFPRHDLIEKTLQAWGK